MKVMRVWPVVRGEEAEISSASYRNGNDRVQSTTGVVMADACVRSITRSKIIQ